MRLREKNLPAADEHPGVEQPDRATVVGHLHPLQGGQHPPEDEHRRREQQAVARGDGEACPHLAHGRQRCQGADRQGRPREGERRAADGDLDEGGGGQVAGAEQRGQRDDLGPRAADPQCERGAGDGEHHQQQQGAHRGGTRLTATPVPSQGPGALKRTRNAPGTGVVTNR